MTLIIAEAGVNHNGDIKIALELVKAAYEAGADIVKFQTFKASNIVTAKANQAQYQIHNTGVTESQLTMLQRLELSYDTHFELLEYCDKLGIEFLSTAFDFESLEFLVNSLKLKKLKIPSGEITNAPLVLQHALTGCDLIVSTGMATLGEIETALGVIAFGYISDENAAPSLDAFQQAYFSKEGQAVLKDKVTLLHCTTEYPTPLNEINLRVVDTMRIAFDLPVGYSDHSEGIIVPIAAVARGSCLIEKHFTLDKNLAGPDHKASLDPSELKKMVQAIRDVEMVLGDSIKGPQQSELKNRAIARKSIVASKKINKGDAFTEKNIDVKRPGDGISPLNYWMLQSKFALKDFDEGDLIVE